MYNNDIFIIAEYRVMLLYVGIMCLRVIKYVKNGKSIYDLFKLLFIGVTILETPCLIASDFWIDKAKELFVEFTDKGLEIFGASWLVIKNHILCHIPEFVKLSGKPLSDTSCFEYENDNMNINKRIKANRFRLVEYRNRYTEAIR